MTSTDLSLVATGLEHRDPDTGMVDGLVFPDGSGAVASLDAPLELGRWKRVVMDVEYGPLRDLKRWADQLIYDAMDAGDGVYTLHGDGVEISGEPRGSWEAATRVDADALYDDLLTLRRRENPNEEASYREAWASSFFKTERSLTDAGRKRLVAIGGVVAETLATHTTPDERARKPITVRRAK